MLSLSFLRTHARLLGFGVLMTFCSSVGQTFFISLFSGEIRAAFALSDGEFGSLYSLGTLASATLLLGAGRLIDRVPLQLFAAAVLVLLATVCLLMGLAGNALVLVVALFGLRFFGQGLASHSAIVAMGRYFEATRGRAVSIATLGHTLGEAVLPSIAVAALALAGWRQVWSGAAVILIALVVNLFFFQSAGMQLVLSIIVPVVFAGLTAFETQMIKNFYYEGDSAEVATRKSIFGAYMLYGSFVTMFIWLMQLFGVARD